MNLYQNWMILAILMSLVGMIGIRATWSGDTPSRPVWIRTACLFTAIASIGSVFVAGITDSSHMGLRPKQMRMGAATNIGNALTLYAGDNDGFLPVAKVWEDMISPYQPYRNRYSVFAFNSWISGQRLQSLTENTFVVAETSQIGRNLVVKTESDLQYHRNFMASALSHDGRTFSKRVAPTSQAGPFFWSSDREVELAKIPVKEDPTQDWVNLVNGLLLLIPLLPVIFLLNAFTLGKEDDECRSIRYNLIRLGVLLLCLVTGYAIIFWSLNLGIG